MLGLIQTNPLQADKTNTMPLVKVFNRRVKLPVQLPEIKEVIQQRKFTITAYDLSFQSTQKSRGSKDYGITSSGFNLKGHTRKSAMTIAVDPKYIPIGSKVKITFINKEYKKYDGLYYSRDKGGAIKNNKIDLFLGDFQQSSPNKLTTEFGVVEAYVEIVKE